MSMLGDDRNCAVNGGDPRVVQRCRARRRGARRLRGRTAENRSRCPTRTTAIEAADSLASGGRSSDEKQNNETLGTRKAEKVEKCMGISGSGDPAASFVFSE